MPTMADAIKEALAAHQNEQAASLFDALQARVRTLAKAFDADGDALVCVKDGLRFFVERIALRPGNLIELSGHDDTETEVHVMYHPLSTGVTFTAAKCPGLTPGEAESAVGGDAKA